ncbi:spermidine/putrescine transport system substrate-binding protein [Streptoalloteichus tenebrarius]|uniref:Spermidine/putrescine transport system substrate-binding protein n=1 Tax=Streptoalloteichus tenebrarius (strain ATCC 17920 / DSM 40477 / JCM 4838 / CBS 697.72 / NBRC 16177 / NCIMB 11028 / NRRL B-12390 / A12253. 1 / ISP 5477) TaxID=1933 RepID=A0ABT1HZ21_STRSD|nr:spermidine/putrescine ABC transporter substrate-binding protein [Streptoalloteichus tenebrarius]MCP2260781.1 spermidine/putrescine transport system substrate-binding protein [Streptoalloteichus tenebrarius]BFF03403.1 polyamine ABC transporter substrate-binding protein [Streptoalloteichus tenebrarius]
MGGNERTVRVARLWDAGSPRMTRRSMLRSMAFFALAAQGAAACGISEAPPAPSGSATDVKATNDVDEKKLNFFNWTDYIADDTVPGFQAETGIQVTYDNFSSNDELEAKIASGAAGYDLVVPSDNFLRRFLRSNLVRPLDHDLIPNLRNLEQRFREADYDPGNRYSIPWAWGTTGLAYSRSQVGAEVTGFSAYDLASVKGRATILDEARDGMMIGLLSLGHDPNTKDARQIEDATRYLLDLKKKIGQITSDVIEPLTSGQVPLAQCYSGDAFQARKANPDLAYAIPREGGMSYVDLLCIPAKAPHAENAHRFLDYVLRPDVGAKLANAIRYGSANAAAKPMIDKELLDDPLVYPPADVLAKLPFTKDLGPDVEARYADAWTRVKTG